MTGKKLQVTTAKIRTLRERLSYLRGVIDGSTQGHSMAAKSKTAKPKAGKKRSPKKVKRTFKTGQVFSRVFKDKKHSVRYTKDGKFRYDGKDYTSLTAIAREITEYKNINGPVFFKV